MLTSFKPGDDVPISGIYRVTHDNHHEAEHEVVCMAGRIFPRCHGCAHPRFIPTHTTLRVESHVQFKTAKRDVRTSSRRHGGVFLIIFFLFVFGLIGVSFIRSAPRLADVPWIASMAKVVLFPPTPATNGSATYKEEERDLLISFFNEVGVAFIVAGILGVTFEISMRRREERQHARHVEEIERAGLSSLLGYLMPVAISDEVRRVFEEKILRSNLKVTFTFGAAPPGLRDSHDLLMVTVRVEYDLVNLTRKATRYSIDHGFETILALGSSHNQFVRLEVMRGDEVVLHWPHGRSANLVQPNSPKPCIRTLVVHDSVVIAPGTEGGPASEDVVHVVVEHQVVRRHSDQDSWTTWLPADRLDVEAVVAPGFLLDLDFHLERTHPIQFVEDKLSQTDRRWCLPSKEIEKNGEKETVSVGVLPYQGFTLYWFPRDSACGTLP
ncbi:MAG: hypothetical protein V7609_1021 [Verrucomicrobiota bacterium]